MSKLEKILALILRGASDQNIASDDLVFLLVSLGFEKRIKGGHHVSVKTTLRESLISSPLATKPSQIRLGKLEPSSWITNCLGNEHVSP